MAGRYAREWQAHVLANLPFYELLPPQFLALTRSRVSSQGDAALADVLKVGQAHFPSTCSQGKEGL